MSDIEHDLGPIGPGSEYLKASWPMGVANSALD
jgi:hypothetical protein